MINQNFDANKSDDDLFVGVHKPTGISRYRTECCALGQLSLNNGHSVEQIKKVIEDIQNEIVRNTIADAGRRFGGEKAVFVITLETEEILAINLAQIGFEKIYEFHRRDCYPQDELLSMWIYSWE